MTGESAFGRQGEGKKINERNADFRVELPIFCKKNTTPIKTHLPKSCYIQAEFDFSIR